MKLGYACINLSLPCTCSKTFRLGSFSQKIFLAAVKNNLNCLMEILKWNQTHGIYFFRISSGLIPFADHPVCQINWQRLFKNDFTKIGRYIRQNKLRVAMHPDHFTILNSPRREIVKKSLESFKYHTDVLDLLGLNSSHKIQIHLGGVYNDKQKSKIRFIKNYQKLPLKIKRRLVLENDDRSFSFQDCREIFQKTKIPLVLDVFHHGLLNNGESTAEAAGLAAKTWRRKDGNLMLDFSSQAENKRRGAHADYIDEKDFRRFLRTTKDIKKDIMLEAKRKEQALLKLIKKF